MTVNRSVENLSEIEQVLRQHAEWLRQMPWVTGCEQSAIAAQKTIRMWIDEFGEDFHDASTPLSASVSIEVCSNRILNLLSGPCRAFVEGAISQSVIYRKIREVLQRVSETSVVENSLNEVRDTFREFGRNDGVRHCVLASAVEAGHERAITAFRDEFDGVRRQLASSFSSRIDESAVDDIWQDVLTDLVWGGVSEA